MTPAIRALRSDDVVPLAASQARAFYDDPLQVWALPDDSTRLDVLTRLFEMMIRVVSLPLGESYTDDTRSVGALWAPPNRWLVDPETAAALEPMSEVVGDRLPWMRRCWEAISNVHPARPHFYLAGLGTDPPLQRKGLGSAALAPVLARCDAEGIPAYLESTKKRNLAFYERHGFVVSRTMTLPLDGPELWTMWREPRPQLPRT